MTAIFDTQALQSQKISIMVTTPIISVYACGGAMEDLIFYY